MTNTYKYVSAPELMHHNTTKNSIEVFVHTHTHNTGRLERLASNAFNCHREIYK